MKPTLYGAFALCVAIPFLLFLAGFVELFL
jgi:hypothetical protein